MPRPLQYGITYFPMDVDFFDDEKIIMVEQKFGAHGIVVATRLLCLIYRNGYFLPWNDKMPFVISKKIGCGITHEIVSNVVEFLRNFEFFDEQKFEEFKILTSRGIQKRWNLIIASCKRKAVMNPIHAISSGSIHQETEVSSGTNEPKTEFSTQSKVKESKENKSKVKECVSEAPARIEILKLFFEMMTTGTELHALEKELLEKREVHEKNAGENQVEIDRVISWFKGQCTQLKLTRLRLADDKANKFYTTYKSNGWNDKHGNPLIDVRTKIEKWLIEDEKFKKSA